jgi:hypothetical protein
MIIVWGMLIGDQNWTHFCCHNLVAIDKIQSSYPMAMEKNSVAIMYNNQMFSHQTLQWPKIFNHQPLSDENFSVFMEGVHVICFW